MPKFPPLNFLIDVGSGSKNSNHDSDHNSNEDIQNIIDSALENTGIYNFFPHSDNEDSNTSSEANLLMIPEGYAEGYPKPNKNYGKKLKSSKKKRWTDREDI